MRCECGWAPEEISFTGTNVSERDLDVLLAAPIHINLDAVSQIERLGRRAPGRTIGLRINPAAGAGYHAGLAYSGERPTKFGIYEDRIPDGAGGGRPAPAHDRHDPLPRRIRLAGRRRARRVRGGARPGRPDHRRPHRGRPPDRGGQRRWRARACRLGPTSVAVDLEAYAAAIARHLGPLGVAVGCEPGDYIAKDAAILLGEVVTVEERGGTTFVGLDLGWNVNCSYFIYRYAQELVVCRAADAPRTEIVTVAGHINEAGDLFAEDYPLQPVVEGDIVAILNAGGYHEAMSSTHCLRPVAGALFLDR